MNVLDQLDALMEDTVPPVLTAPQSVRDRWRWAMQNKRGRVHDGRRRRV
jgi:hypothetical protein